jgi:hypothetical protein
MACAARTSNGKPHDITSQTASFFDVQRSWSCHPHGGILFALPGLPAVVAKEGAVAELELVRPSRLSRGVNFPKSIRIRQLSPT